MTKAALRDFFDPNLPLRSFFAPGRINLIGEHLDYNGGRVFPGAISLGITGTVQERRDRFLVFRSAEEPGEVRVHTDETIRFDPARGWANYPLGAMHYLRQGGHDVRTGMSILYSSTLPRGSGLSSSAAMELLTAFILARPGDDERIAMALLMQKMENEFIGVHCGIMDQFAIAMGRRGHAMLLDTDTLGYECVPVSLPGHTLVVIDSNRPRALTNSKYNQRRDECAAALEAIRGTDPSVTNLAAASPALVETIRDPVLKRRARHVVTENARVLDAARALRAGDLPRFGALLSESHRSLRDDYEVTGLELDTIAAASLEAPGCAGARMTGAGFGGCALALVEIDALEAFKKFVAKKYRARTNRPIGFHETDMADGVRELADGEKPGTQA
ncbi:MAG: galactokinase [Spirochaetes bacterium]|nr:galactokinase [Spirochaetota bacterium]